MTASLQVFQGNVTRSGEAVVPHSVDWTTGNKAIAQYEIDSFRVDLRHRRLLHEGKEVPLAPKAFELLVALAETAGRVISKRELLDRLWPDTFVEEANIAQNICLLRKALAAASESLVVTVPRVGYQLTAEVKAVPTTARPVESEPIAAAPTDVRSREAFRHYLRGRYSWNKRTVRGLQEALACATRVVEADPALAKGYVAIADTYALLAAQYTTLAPHEAFPRARAAAARALEIDAECGEAHTSMAFANWWYDWNFEAGERAFRKAIELRPLYATSYHWYAEALASAGRFEESLSHYEMAVTLDPLSSAVRADYAAALSLAGKGDECERILDETLRFDPGFVRARVAQAVNRERNAALASARQSLTAAMRREPQASDIVALNGRIAARAGRRSEAQAALKRLTHLAGRKRVGDVDRALLEAAIGHFERARVSLQAAFATREAQLLWIVADSGFAVLRDRTGFVALWQDRENPRPRTTNGQSPV